MQRFWRVLASAALVGMTLAGCNKPAASGSAGKWGYIDKTGNFIIQPQFDEASDFKDGTAFVRDGKRILRLQAKPPGESRDPVKPDDSPSLGPLPTLRAAKGDGEAFRVMDGKEIVFDVSKKAASPAVFHDSDYVCVQFNDKYCFIDKMGAMAFGTPFAGARNFSEGRAAVKDSGKWGYMTRKGRFVLPPKYLDAGSFVDGLAPVKIPSDTK